ncbi:pentapeptide repeat-containing protein [Streptomyces anulatus]|uniref:pentapeptide repeat-containing protein n=1 Tax=Streptomyces anulatus TaxID=1892 RepID=UPI00324BAB64
MTNPLQRHPKQDGRHTPNLWPVWLVAPCALVAVGATAYGLYHGADTLLSSGATGGKPVSAQEVIKTTVTVLTLIGAVFAALYAYRKQLIDEGTSHRADAAQLTERYSKSAEQLGHEQAAVRLAGVYAMARLADDWPEQRQVCVDVLCAYLRMPYATNTTDPGFRHGEREVRLTIIRAIRDHLQEPAMKTTWCGRNLDFSGATFDGCDLRGSMFVGGTVDFSGSTFSDGTIYFSGSTFSGGEVDFNGSTFSGGEVDFNGSTFSGGEVDFSDSRFSGSEVDFRESTFSGGEVSFMSSQFTSGLILFSESRYYGGLVTFNAAHFEGGEVLFNSSLFSGSTVDFSSSTYSGGEVYLEDSSFSGSEIDFEGSQFIRGEVSFRNSTHESGTVNFQRVSVDAGATIHWGPLPAISAN